MSVFFCFKNIYMYNKLNKIFMRDIIREEFIKVLVESKVSRRESTSRKILRRNSLEKNGKEMTKAESDLELHNIKSLIPNSSNSDSLECLYLPSVTRMYCNGEFKNSDISQKVNSIIGYLCKKKIVEDLEKITAQGLIDKYDEVVQNINKADNDKAKQNAQNSVANKGYVIKKITSFEEAKEYSKYVDWCVTIDEYQFKNNTEGGKLPFFFCLKEGYDTIQRPEEKTGNAKDEYGLSMIAVVFNGDMIHRATTRWNHDNGGNDNMFTMTELVDVVGSEIVECKKDVISMLNKFYDDIEKKLKSGKNLEDVFYKIYEYDNINICGLDDKYYILNKKNEFIYKNSFNWFGQYSDTFGEFNEGFCIIRTGLKMNYINTNGEIISNEWFDYCWRFKNGFGAVGKEYKKNYINTNGEIISNEWFDNCKTFGDGFGIVQKNNKYNYINTNGEIISNEWFDDCKEFSDGFGPIKKDGMWNYINANGKLLSNQWFDWCSSFAEGIGFVKLNSKFYKIDKNGNPLNECVNKSINLMKRMMLL